MTIGDLIHRPAWMAHAACAGQPTSLWYPPTALASQQRTRGVGQRVADQTTRAVAICRGCPVRVHCAAHALANDETFGVWGGLTERQREQIRRGEPITA